MAAIAVCEDPSCGFVLRLSAGRERLDACPVCGEALVTECPSCGETLRVSAARCPACGERVRRAVLSA